MPKKKSKGKGFTLVELLVTISILAILMTIAMISYSGIQKGARDAKRKTDISKIQAALEQYHADQGYYPSSTITQNSNLTDPSGNKIYLQVMPKEVIGSNEYPYYYLPFPWFCVNEIEDPLSICRNYCLFAVVENTANNVAAAQCSSATNQYQVQAP